MLWAPFLILSTLVASIQSQQQQTIVENPTDLRVLRGDTALLRCKVANQVGPVQWTKNGFGLGNDRSLPRKPRYSMIGSLSDGEYHLEIKNVDMSDSGKYQCQLGRAASQPFRSSTLVTLVVLVPPTPPTFINVQDLISATEEREFNVDCVSNGGNPAAKMSWVISESSDGGSVVRSFEADKIVNDVKSRPVTVKDKVLNNVFVYDARSSLRFKPTKEDNGKFLACIATHETVQGKMVADALLNVNYAPKVRVELKNTEPLKENSVATLSCEVTAQPRNSLSYKWRKDGNEQIGKFQKTLVIPRIGREHHGSVYTCEARNIVGSGSGEIRLDVLYGPLFQTLLKPTSADVGGTVILHCRADSNPPAKITWTKIGNPGTILADGANFTITKLTEVQRGEYRCKASAEGFKPVYTTTEIHINGPPTVIMQKVVRTPLSSTVQITCQVLGSPKPKIQWMKNSRLLNESQDFEYERTNFDPGYGEHISIIKIHKVTEDDFGTYTCRARNSFAVDSATTHLKEKSLISLYLLLPIMIGGLVLLVCLIIFVIFCYRRSLCASKTTTHSGGDEHSDVNVKVEALDGNGIPLNYCPDMYSPVSITENGEVVQYGKDYFPVPQDNPDLDLLPPPYASYVHAPPASTYSYYNGSTAGTTFHPQSGNRDSNGHLVHMTYLDDQPMTSHQRILYAYSDQYGNLVEAYPPADYPNGHLSSGEYIGNGNGDEYSVDNGNHLPDMSQQGQIYYPSQYLSNGSVSNGGQNAPLATLEPVQELPTPEESVGHGPSASASQYSTFQPPTSVTQSSSGDYGRQPSPPTFSTMVNSGSTNLRSPVGLPNGGFTAAPQSGGYNAPIVTTPSLHYPNLNSTPIVSAQSSNV